MNFEIYTIGHSTHPIDVFAGLLERHGITAVCDVRSTPYSRFNPQFNRETLRDALRGRAIEYVFLGKELGARSEDSACYRGGKVDYELLARTSLFKQGLQRVREGARRFKIALMCAERDPLRCHRTILVARNLSLEGMTAKHILPDGRLETQDQAEARLLASLKLPETDLFRSRHEVVRDAYRVQGNAIAYSRDNSTESGVQPQSSPSAACRPLGG